MILSLIWLQFLETKKISDFSTFLPKKVLLSEMDGKWFRDITMLHVTIENKNVLITRHKKQKNSKQGYHAF